MPFVFWFLLGLVLVTGWFVFMYVRKQKGQIHKLKNEYGRLMTDYHILESQLKHKREDFQSILIAEHKRIATDLHDDSVQRMVAVRFKLEQLQYMNSDKAIDRELSDLREELNEIIATLRFLIKGLVQPRFDQLSFSRHIESLVRSLTSKHHLKVELQIKNPEQEFDMPAEVKQNLYYIIHEACHNFLKNSMGFQLHVLVIWGTELVINIIDNGQGINKGRGYGLGMQSMQDRADHIQAYLDFKSIILGLNIEIRLKNRF